MEAIILLSNGDETLPLENKGLVLKTRAYFLMSNDNLEL